jgi:hypothetical protein
MSCDKLLPMGLMWNVYVYFFQHDPQMVLLVIFVDWDQWDKNMMFIYNSFGHILYFVDSFLSCIKSST